MITPKAGDRIIDTRQNGFYEGEIGTILYVLEDMALYRAELDNGAVCWYNELQFKVMPSYQIEITTYPMNCFNAEDYATRTTMNVYPGHNNPNYRTPVTAIKSQKIHYRRQGFYITWKVQRLPYNLG